MLRLVARRIETVVLISDGPAVRSTRGRNALYRLRIPVGGFAIARDATPLTRRVGPLKNGRNSSSHIFKGGCVTYLSEARGDSSPVEAR